MSGLAVSESIPPMNQPLPGPMFPPRSSSAARNAPSGPASSFAPGQIVPGSGPRPGQDLTPSFGPGQTIPSTGPTGPGQIVPPPRGTSNPYRPPGPPGPSATGFPTRPGPQGFPGNVPNGPFPQGESLGPSIPPGAPPGSRPPSDASYGGSLRKSPSSRSLASQSDHSHHVHVNAPAPPMPTYPEGLPPPPRLPFLNRNDSSSSLNSLQAPQPRTLLPSAQFRGISTVGSFIEPSPPNSPVEETPRQTGPVTSAISAQMKCKVFLKQHHAQWKSLGSAKLRLYRESPTNVKQLVVEADNSKKTVLISTIVLEDGVERVGKTGVAIELSDRGQRTGIVYMIQLRNEESARGLFDSLLAGSDRSTVGGGR